MSRVDDARAIATAMILDGYHPEGFSWDQDLEILSSHTTDVVTGLLAYAFTLRDRTFEEKAFLAGPSRAWRAMHTMCINLIARYEAKALAEGHDVTGGLNVLKPR